MGVLNTRVVVTQAGFLTVLDGGIKTHYRESRGQEAQSAHPQQ